MSQPGPMGWGLPNVSESALHDLEKRAFDDLAKLAPRYLMRHDAREPKNDALIKRVEDRVKAAGWDEGMILPFLFDEATKMKPAWLRQLIGSCFQAGTLIRMADGSHKQIQDIRVFDKVLTAEGNVGYVTATMGREADELMYSVKLWGHKAVEMTGEHPLLTKRGYVKASELQLDDFVAVPKYLPQKTTILETSAYALRNGQAIRRSRRHATSSRSVSVGPIGTLRKEIPVHNTIPDLIYLDSRFGRLCGLYLAEGNADENKLVFTFNINERDTLAREVIDLWRDVFDVEAVLSSPTKQVCKNGKKVSVVTTCKVTVHSTIWAVTFKNLFGTGSSKKSLPPDIASGPKEFLEALVGGWLDGDGHQKTETTIQGTTVSKALSLDIHAICNGLDMMPTLTSSIPKIGNGVKTRQVRFDVHLRNPSKSLCCNETESHVWRKVRELSSRAYVGKVYNFEVHGDNSYVAEGLGVHNCVASGDMRTTAYRMVAEIFVFHDPEELPGTKFSGPESLAFFAPFSYRAGRKLAGINGNSDGSLCLPHIRGKMQFGHLPCNTPGLTVDAFPEPQREATYKQWGANDTLLNQFASQAAPFKLLESEPVKSVDDIHTLICDHLKPANICSSWGFRTTGKSLGQDANGATIKQWTRSGTWHHNMSVVGHVKRSGTEYVIVENSWGNYHDGSTCFAVEAGEMDRWLKQSECQSVGEIDLTDSGPAVDWGTV
jgi:hypothetical protein